MYKPGAAFGGSLQEGALVLVRDLPGTRETAWAALTQPDLLAQWSPFEASRNLGSPGSAGLHTIGTPGPVESVIARADAPEVLQYTWNGNDLRWTLSPLEGATRLSLRHQLPSEFLAMGAAGWHICLGVLGHLLAGSPVGRIVGPDAMNYEWPRLKTEYADLLGV